MPSTNQEVNRCTSDDESGGTKDDKNKCHQRNVYKDGKHRRPQQKANSSELDPNGKDNLEISLKLLIEVCKTLGQRIKRILDFILIDMGGNQLIDRFARWCVQHPQMAICLLVAGLVTSLPILLFVGFALSTIVMTFTGFLVLEGTLLTILAMIMFGLLGALSLVLLFFALVGVATYFGVSRVYDMYSSTETQRRNLRSAMERNN